MVTARTRSDEFLELVRRSRQGRLKMFLGPAAGVGKTYRMLVEARELQSKGVDVALGAIETHGRPDTEALLAGLERIPARTVEYRGVRLDELDLEAVLARAPEIAVVDEIAHTNAPGSQNQKRYQDVLEILRAGINVFGAMNVQHLESLNDVVKRVTGVTVRETVPDSFLRRADQIVNIDLPADDLLDRLNAGKVYPTDRVAWALEHFFRRENLESLRELALREVAESIGRAQLVSEPPAGARAVPGRLMVCLSSRPPRAVQLLRRASRMAGRLNSRWYAVYVETPRESPTRIDAETQRRLFEVQDMARSLGAEVHHVEATDPVDGILDFARAHGIRDIVLGASEQAWFRRMLGLTVPQRLVVRGAEFDLHFLAADQEDL